MQRFVRWVLAPLARLILRPTVSGSHRIPRRGPVLLAANHRAAVDTALLAFVTPRPVAFLGKAEYFTGRGLRRRLSARFLTALGYIPVDRDHAKAGLAALDAARKVLERGDVFAIYPEGTRSRDGRLHRATPASPRSRWRPARRSSRSRWSAPSACSPSASACRGSRRCRSGSAARSTSPVTRGWKARP